jgi:predicted metal-dependent hydrolase
VSVAALQYAVKVSPKARNLRLKLTLQRGLEVIVPRGFDPQRIPGLLSRKKHWIESAQRRLQEQRKFFKPKPLGELPDHVVLRALGETWRVEYREAQTPWAAAYRQSQDRLVIRGNVENVAACQDALRRWLARRCHDAMVPWLREISREKRLPFGRTLVKMQKTRWASCSRHRTVSLNLKLLFLPPELVRYVFVHELCHTVHMNHSREFWRVLAVKEPGYMELDKQLRTAWRLVPAWIGQQAGDGLRRR